MKKRILVISWFYPPVNSSEGLVTYKLLKSSKYNYDVFTQMNSSLWSYGNENVLPSSSNVHAIYAKAKNLSEWQEEAIKFYKKNKENYDIVMTRSMPPESHKIGLRIKKENPNIKWIASFGDPIAENPYTKIATSYQSPYSRAVCRNILGVISPKRIFKNTLFNLRYKKQQKRIIQGDKNLQSQIFKHADFIIFNSKFQKDYMLSLYSTNYDSKSIVLNHSYDSSLYPLNTVIKNDNKIIMNYVGHLDNIRTPILFLQAIKELAEEDINLASKFHINFYGNMDDQDKLFIINNELTDIITIKKPVSYLKSLEIMKNSDWLLQIDANISQIIDKNIFFAAKLADYIGANSKIFGITMLDGISTEIMNKLNALCVSYSKNEIKNYLWLIIYEGYTLELNQKYREEFDCINVAKNFDAFIKSIR